jgi:hypothetical protein
MNQHSDTNRHLMKATYQRNMIMAQLVVIGLCGVALLVSYIADQARPARDPHARVIESSVAIRDTSIIERDSTRHAQHLLPLFNPFARRHEGFLGFATLRLVPDEPSPVSAPTPMAILVPEVVPDEFNVSYSLTPGADTGLFLPEGVRLSPFLPADTSHKSVNLPVRLVHSVKPKVPPIATWNNKDGYVEVLLFVDSLGNQQHFSCRKLRQTEASGPAFTLSVVVKGEKTGSLEFYVDSRENNLLYVNLVERPKDYHFADYLMGVLPQWTFAPAVRDSRPVSSFVIIQYRFCRESDPDCHELLLRSVS